MQEKTLLHQRYFFPFHHSLFSKDTILVFVSDVLVCFSSETACS